MIFSPKTQYLRHDDKTKYAVATVSDVRFHELMSVCKSELFDRLAGKPDAGPQLAGANLLLTILAEIIPTETRKKKNNDLEDENQPYPNASVPAPRNANAVA